MSELKIDIDRETAKGRYANLAVIAHSKHEFIIDFALVQPQGDALVVARVLMSPAHAKAFLDSLAENIRRYEADHGPIEPGTAPGMPWGEA